MTDNQQEIAEGFHSPEPEPRGDARRACLSLVPGATHGSVRHTIGCEVTI